MLTPFRTQDRNLTPIASEEKQPYHFTNRSDTDFALEQNRKWAENIRDKWQNIGKHGGFNAYPVIGGATEGSQEAVAVIDKSQYHDKVIVGK